MTPNNLIDKAAIYTYARFAKPKSAKRTDAVAILFFGMIGDAVMFLDALATYRQFYVEEQGRLLVVFCRNEARKLFCEAGLDDGILFEELHRVPLINDFRYFRTRVEIFNEYGFSLLLHVRSYNALEDLFIHVLDCPVKVCSRGSDVGDREKPMYRCFINDTYDKVVFPDDGEDQLTRYGLLLKDLLLPTYKSKVYELSSRDAPYGLSKHSYILISPGASESCKAWPAEKFAAISDYVIKEHSLPVILSGTKDDLALGDEIIAASNLSYGLVNCIGKTSYSEWFGLIGNAALVITNESGAVHVAAAMKTPCVCIGAQEFGDTFLPYRPELVRLNDQLPLTVRSEKLSCYYCKRRKQRMDERGNVCYMRTGTFPCVENISYSQVQDAVQSLLDCPIDARA